MTPKPDANNNVSELQLGGKRVSACSSSAALRTLQLQRDYSDHTDIPAHDPTDTPTYGTTDTPAQDSTGTPANSSDTTVHESADVSAEDSSHTPVHYSPHTSAQNFSDAPARALESQPKEPGNSTFTVL